jgi:hypothetical protein
VKENCDLTIIMCLCHFDVTENSQELPEDGLDKWRNASELWLKVIGLSVNKK